VTFEKFKLFNLIETFISLVSTIITYKSEAVNSFPDSGWECPQEALPQASHLTPQKSTNSTDNKLGNSR
jgi:hypothetical protein